MKRIVILLACIYFLKSYSQTTQFNKKDFIEICKSITSIKKIRKNNLFCSYKGKNTVFIKSDTSFIKIDKRIDLNPDSTINLSIWFKKELFFENIPYWFEISILSLHGKEVNVKIISYNSVNTDKSLKIKRIKGMITLTKQPNGTFKVKKSKLKILPPA